MSAPTLALTATARFTVPCNGPALSLPLYPCDNVDFQVTTYYSNICPNGAYQGYGAPKGNFAITMALAELAEQLQIDQLEIIERNRVHEGQRAENSRCNW
ncbi:molybdopterin cofactor-binding domain-containing protein [Escherichia coli]